MKGVGGEKGRDVHEKILNGSRFHTDGSRKKGGGADGVVGAGQGREKLKKRVF